MQFYPEKMIPLRIPTAQERLDLPLVDIYLPHGRREKHRKINRPEADVIVGEIKSLTAQPAMRNRSIGVISLIGPHQAEYVRTKLSETIGEELMQRHAILCGDSATFQGTERDIVFLSMVADPVHRTALTMLRYAQRFNVAVSRGRDRVVLVRSVRREDLNPTDLKARLIAHFENPMPLEKDSGDEGLAACDSGFERDLMQKLLDRGYRVQPQVGSLGFHIDMVVEGADGRRLAVECDGDRFHGPEQWREDMRRQRVLERVGWRFWRCFASSFYRDSDRVIGDLFETLSRLGIEPMPKGESARPSGRFTEHRIVGTAEDGSPSHQAASSLPQKQPQLDDPDCHAGLRDGVAVGDKVVLLFGDDQRRISLRLTEGTHGLEKGLLSSTSALGKAINGAEEGDEIEFEQEDGRETTCTAARLRKGGDILIIKPRIRGKACWPISEPFKGLTLFNEALRKFRGRFSARPDLGEMRSRDGVKFVVNGGDTSMKTVDLRLHAADRATPALRPRALDDRLNFTDRAFDLSQALALIGQDRNRKRLNFLWELIFQNGQSRFAA
jgi:very-short-patch-repair endonuclease